MKKVIVIALLITALSTLLICGGVCLAEDTQTNYYYVGKGCELTMRATASVEGKVVMQIPATYAFEFVEQLDGFIKINYNGYSGFVSNADFNQYCKAVTSKWGDAPYFYTISLKTSDVTDDKITFYNLDKTPYENAVPKELVTIDKVYGYYHNESGAYYFLVDATTKILDNSSTSTVYIKASDTSTYASFSKDTVAESAGYVAETNSNNQSTPSGDDGTPTITDPGNKDSNGSSVPATNNFERYLLIAVIAVLCVVIIILIFAPNKSKRKQ